MRTALLFALLAVGPVKETKGPVTQSTDSSLECEWSDLNGDGEVGVADFLEVLSQFGEQGDLSADYDNDGDVDVLDLIRFINCFGQEV